MVCLDKGQFFGNPEPVASLAGLRISQARYSPLAQLPRHSHAQPYLCLVAAGAFEERARRRLETCHAGSVVWNPSGDEHADRFGHAGARTLNLEFDEGWGERLAEAARVWTPGKGIEVSWLTRRIQRELVHADTASALAIEGLVCALIGEVSRAPADVDPRCPAWLSRARDRLMVEYRDAPRVAELAREAGVHRSHFARSFRTHVGCTVAELVRRLRIEWAAEELRKRRGTLSEISLQAGFGDQAHFTRTFKLVTGSTPGEYRATVR